MNIMSQTVPKRTHSKVVKGYERFSWQLTDSEIIILSLWTLCFYVYLIV